MVRMHERGRGSSKSVHLAYQGVDTSEYVRKVPFCVSLVIFSYARYFMSYFVVVGDDFHYCLIKHSL